MFIKKFRYNHLFVYRYQPLNNFFEASQLLYTSMVAAIGKFWCGWRSGLSACTQNRTQLISRVQIHPPADKKVNHPHQNAVVMRFLEWMGSSNSMNSRRNNCAPGSTAGVVQQFQKLGLETRLSESVARSRGISVCCLCNGSLGRCRVSRPLSIVLWVSVILWMSVRNLKIRIEKR